MPTEPLAPRTRLVSIDALRGFDMLMIAGAGKIIEQLGGKTSLPWVDALAQQFKHPAWFGFTFYDCIFPLFLFLAGVSIPFSLSKAIAQNTPKTDIYKKAFVRLLILIVLGMIDKNQPFPFFDPHQIRMGSVLGRTCVAPRWRRGWSRGGRGTLESAGGSLPRVCGHRTTCFAAPSRSTAPKNGRR